MVTDKNDHSEDKFDKMKADMQRELASIDDDANTLTYERSVKQSKKKNPVCQKEILFDHFQGQLNQQTSQVLQASSKEFHPPRQTQDGAQKQNQSSNTSNLIQKKYFTETRRDRSSSDRSHSREREHLSTSHPQNTRSEAPNAERQANEVQRMTVDQKISPSKGKGTFQPREPVNQKLTQNQRSVVLPSSSTCSTGAAGDFANWNKRQHDKLPNQYMVNEQLLSTTDAHVDLKQHNLPKSQSNPYDTPKDSRTDFMLKIQRRKVVSTPL